MKISIPHIHKIEGETGFLARVAKTGQVKDLRLTIKQGLRQIEGILIGRRVQDVPLVVSRICGICPVVHILNAISALEKAIKIKVSPATLLLRKLFLASQIIQSNALHLFFLALPDFFDIENDLDLMKKFRKETKAALAIRDFSLKITEVIGGRKVHPVTPQIGGFGKTPDTQELKKIYHNDFSGVLKDAEILAKTFLNLEYPRLEKETTYSSLFSKKEYPFYQSDFLLVKDKKLTAGDFYSNKIEEDLKIPPVKRVKYKGSPYMVGAIARLKNNKDFLSPLSRHFFEEFKRKNKLSDQDFFKNIYHNIFAQMVEILHFLESSREMTAQILKSKIEETGKEIKIVKGSGLSAMEAPRGTLFTYFELDNQGRVLNCNIFTPTAQFLSNLEEDLKILLPNILNLSQKEKKRKIRALIRVYDPCISCATH